MSRRWLLSCLLLLLLPLHAQAGEVVRLTNGFWPPMLGEKYKHHGVLSRIVSESFAMEGYDVEYGFFPWKRSFELARNGEWDGTIVWHQTTEREAYFLFSDPVFYDKLVFFHLVNSKFDWKNYEDLSKYAIGITLGYHYSNDLDRLLAEGAIQAQRAATDELNLRKLLAGRIDAFVCNIEIGYYLLRTRFSPGAADLVTNHPKFIATPEAQRVLISKASKNAQKLVDAFNRGLGKLKKSGKYEQYMLESRRGDYLP